MENNKGNKGNVKRKRFSPPPKNSINLLNLSPCVWQLRGGFFGGDQPLFKSQEVAPAKPRNTQLGFRGQ